MNDTIKVLWSHCLHLWDCIWLCTERSGGGFFWQQRFSFLFMFFIYRILIAKAWTAAQMFCTGMTFLVFKTQALRDSILHSRIERKSKRNPEHTSIQTTSKTAQGPSDIAEWKGNNTTCYSSLSVTELVTAHSFPSVYLPSNACILEYFDYIILSYYMFYLVFIDNVHCHVCDEATVKKRKRMPTSNTFDWK